MAPFTTSVVRFCLLASFFSSSPAIPVVPHLLMVEEEEKPISLSALSSGTLAALQAVLREREAAVEACASDPFAAEDWGKSQFVYTAGTAATLAAECARLGTSVACVSCPTLFRTLLDSHPTVRCHLLEFDEKYSSRGSFTLYDYNQPTDLPTELLHSFDVVVADPPYLAEECLSKTAQTVHLLLRTPESPRLLLTGAVMRGVARRVLGVQPVSFRPQHASKLGNEFLCFASYQPPPESALGGWDAELAAEEKE